MLCESAVEQCPLRVLQPPAGKGPCRRCAGGKWTCS